MSKCLNVQFVNITLASLQFLGYMNDVSIEIIV